ncbi:hypothetical protein BN1708_015986 [Verticillium longisporum]|uniref:Uncharacterized protein n=1 Tax=Verticillium longisporum TaxID=100787 RepID=A0A0G4MCD5_VERLO|nr:hypothetical protein BN1708_015986 [Verticillium longisporum]
MKTYAHKAIPASFDNASAIKMVNSREFLAPKTTVYLVVIKATIGLFICHDVVDDGPKPKYVIRLGHDVGNAKAWWRRGRCLQEMGRLEEAREWVRRGLGMEGEEAELVALLRDIETRIARGSKA